MEADQTIVWSQFASYVGVAVAVPSLVAALICRVFRRAEAASVSPAGARGTGAGRLGLPGTAALAFSGGVLACAGWLTWTAADHDGAAVGPSLSDPPTAFPAWQVWGCGVTVVLVCLLAAGACRWAFAGSVAAAAGTAAGFTTAFSVPASTDVTGQSGVGVVSSEVGWGVGLTVVTILWTALRSVVARRRVGAQRPGQELVGSETR